MILNQYNQTKLKFGVIGDRYSGKSNFLWKLTENEYNISLNPTIGLQYYSLKKVHINKNVKIDIWDVINYEKNFNIQNMFLKNIISILFILDYTKEVDIDKLAETYKTIKNYNKLINFGIFINKIDLKNLKQINIEELIIFSESKNLKIYYVSSLTGENLYESFNLFFKDTIIKLNLN